MISLIGNNKTDGSQESRWAHKYWRSIQTQVVPADILDKLERVLNKKLKASLKSIPNLTESFEVMQAIQLAVDLLCNSKLEVEKSLKRRNLITGDVAIALIDDEIAKFLSVIKRQQFDCSPRARSTVVFVVNQLFCAKQQVKNQFSIVTKPLLIEEAKSGELGPMQHPGQLSETVKHGGYRMTIHSSVLVQLNQSLFPAERMIVASGIKSGDTITVGGIYDVTGNASSVGVQADANLLARALIAMETTETYFALWVHSHPGNGRHATNPSPIDLNQEADWLKDYSANLVNAIMVEDRIIRFWGKSIDAKRVKVEILGSGAKQIDRNVYKLG